MRDLFSQATELPTAERISFVQQVQVETDLRSEIISLIHADQCQKKKPITGAIGTALEASIEERRQKLVGSIVGKYRLLSVIGHGGTGTVYLAERIDAEGESKVAIKIVESAAINGIARRRFRDERQILANLNHLNIARLFDAGDTRDGYPYVAMDYIEGEPIDRYCDRHCLTIRQRIQLFLKVCDAVEYAHRNLVIHRDLKPQNILVARDGIPKLLDFGIAKLLAERSEPQEFAITQFHDQLLTPAYASPEQVLGKNISTSSDVYTLGIVLYELLSGTKPFDQIKASSHLEYERIVLTQEPPPLTRAIQSLIADAANDSMALLRMQRIEATRGAAPARLQSLFTGDLDAILSRVLRPRMEDRYESVEQLANDLECFLDHRPVSARNGNWLYYTNRFIGKHALAVTAIALLVLALITSTAIILRQSNHLELERDKAFHEKAEAESVVNFMVDVFANDSEHASNQAPTLARDLLERAAIKIHDDFPKPTITKAELLEAVANGERKLGMADRAIPLFEEALQIRRRVDARNDIAIAHNLRLLGKALLFNHQPEKAPIALYGALSILSKAQQSPEYALLLIDLGHAAYQQGEPMRARQYLEQALPLLRSAYGPEHPEVGSALISLAFAYEWQSEHELAEKTAREAVYIYQKSMPALHPERLVAEQFLAECLLILGQIDKAASILETVLVRSRRIFDSQSSYTAHFLTLLTNLRLAQHRFAEAETIATEVVNIKRIRFGDNNYDTAYSRTTLAIVQLRLGKYSAAERQLRAALEIYHLLLSEDNLLIASAEHFLAESLLAQGRLAETTAQTKTTLHRLKRVAATEWRIARSEGTLGQTLLKLRKFREAQPLLEHSYQVLSSSIGPDQDTVQLAHDRLERFYLVTHQRAKLAALRISKQQTN